MTRIPAIVAGIAALIAGGLVFAGMNFSAPGAPRISLAVAAELPQGLQTVKLKIKKMDCASCVYILRRTLEELDGVASAKVSYGKATAIVEYDPTRCRVAQLTAATAGIGFPSTVIE